jgi:hypothetical protein
MALNPSSLIASWTLTTTIAVFSRCLHPPLPPLPPPPPPRLASLMPLVQMQTLADWLGRGPELFWRKQALIKRSHSPRLSPGDRNHPLILRSFPPPRFSMSYHFPCPPYPPLELYQSGVCHQPLTLVRSPSDLDQPRKGHFQDIPNFQSSTSSIHSNVAGSFQWTTSGPLSSRPKRPRMEKFFGSSSLPSSTPTWSSALLRLYLTPSIR